jgi:uncharacterized membrane protein YbaN (DUF454 family)
MISTQAKNFLLIIAGWLSIVFGVIGMFLPLLPTVPLLLLAAACFARSSPSFHAWLLNHRHLGPIVRQYQSGDGVPMRVKVRAITVIWLSMFLSMYIVGKWWSVALLTTIGACTTAYLLWRLPTARD